MEIIEISGKLIQVFYTKQTETQNKSRRNYEICEIGHRASYANDLRSKKHSEIIRIMYQEDIIIQIGHF